MNKTARSVQNTAYQARLEAGYARLNDKIDALRRLVTLIEVGAAIVLLIALGSLL